MKIKNYKIRFNFKSYVISFVLIFCSCFTINAKAQLLDSIDLVNAHEYTSIAAAMHYPDSVYKLVLKHKHLKIIPPEVYQFKNLQSLDLSHNKLEELPNNIDTLSNLQEIIVAYNNLFTLPPQIGHLKHLKKLALYQNVISILPSTIGDLKELQILDLWSNEIVEFPDEIAKLKHLKILDLRGISMNDEQKNKITLLLPNVEVQLSGGCNCGK